MIYKCVRCTLPASASKHRGTKYFDGIIMERIVGVNCQKLWNSCMHFAVMPIEVYK